MAYLASLDVYKSWAGITGTTYDTVLAIVLASVSAEIRRACGRDETTGFESASRTEYCNGSDGDSVLLNEYPVTALTSVSVRFADGTSETLDADTYRVDAKTGILSRVDVSRGRFVGGVNIYRPTAGEFQSSPFMPDGFGNVVVVYTAGYATIPSDLQTATCQLADMLFYGVRGRDTTFVSETIGQYTYNRGDMKMRAAIKDGLVANFRRGVP